MPPPVLRLDGETAMDFADRGRTAPAEVPCGLAGCPAVTLPGGSDAVPLSADTDFPLLSLALRHCATSYHNDIKF